MCLSSAILLLAQAVLLPKRERAQPADKWLLASGIIRQRGPVHGYTRVGFPRNSTEQPSTSTHDAQGLVTSVVAQECVLQALRLPDKCVC